MLFISLRAVQRIASLISIKFCDWAVFVELSKRANQETCNICAVTEAAKSKMADYKTELEERLREVCCIGDEKNVQLLVQRGVSINAPNAMNGWTPLHWAAKRGRTNVVKYLLQEGVDTTVRTNKGETAGQLSNDAGIRKMLGEEETIILNSNSENLPIVPNYLRNPEFFYVHKTSENSQSEKRGQKNRDDLIIANQDCSIISNSREGNNPTCNLGSAAAQPGEEIVLKLRIANSEEEDFIEVDLDRSSLTFQILEIVCCDELGIEANNIKKIRKLPNTIVRNDRDTKRLVSFQELEVVLKGETS